MIKSTSNEYPYWEPSGKDFGDGLPGSCCLPDSNANQPVTTNSSKEDLVPGGSHSFGDGKVSDVGSIRIINDQTIIFG